jgi:hypothetical protein
MPSARSRMLHVWRDRIRDCASAAQALPRHGEHHP